MLNGNTHKIKVIYFRPSITEEELTDSFSQHGEVKAFKFFQ